MAMAVHIYMYSYVKKLCNLRFSWEKLVFVHEEREIQVQNWKAIYVFDKNILLCSTKFTKS